MIKYGREYVYRPLDQLEEGEVQPMLTFDNNQIINTELEIFNSKELIEKVVSTIGVTQLYPNLARQNKGNSIMIPSALHIFRKHLSISHIKETNVIRVTFQHKNPKMAVEAINLLTEFFKEKHLKLFKNPEASFLEKQVALYDRKLEQLENHLRNYKQQNKIYSLENQRKLLLEQFLNVKTKFILGLSKAKEFEERIASLEIGLENVPERVVLFNQSSENSNIDDARKKLLDLKIHESEIIEKYQEDNRLLSAVRDQIKMVNNFIRDRHDSQESISRTGESYIFQEVKKELILAQAAFKAQTAKNRSLQEQVTSLGKQLQNFAAKERDLKKLQLKIETTEKNYKTFISKLEENRILNEMDKEKMVNVAVIEKPMIPVKPVKPRKKLNLLIGVILGIAVSSAYALLFDDSFFLKKP